MDTDETRQGNTNYGIEWSNAIQQLTVKALDAQPFIKVALKSFGFYDKLMRIIPIIAAALMRDEQGREILDKEFGILDTLEQFKNKH